MEQIVEVFARNDAMVVATREISQIGTNLSNLFVKFEKIC